MKIKKIQGNNLFAYRRMRRAIGYLGIFLPIILVLLSFFKPLATDIQPSISHYYFSNLREIFTGTLCAVALFLICYKGHGNASIWKNDNLLTNIAGLMALGVALVPTSPITESQLVFALIPYDLEWLHYGFAAVLFLIFSLLSINVFTIGQEPDSAMPASIWNENNIYRFCGYSILVFIILIPFSLFAYSTLVFEALSLFMFGISWLVKGRGLGDKGIIGEKLYREHNAFNTEEMAEVEVEMNLF